MKKAIKQAVILAAGERKDFENPVGFLQIEDTTIIERLIVLLNSNGIDNITLVSGYKSEQYEELAKRKNLNFIYNDRFKWTGTMHSLSLAEEFVTGDFLLIESDTVFEERAIELLLENEEKNIIFIANESGSGDEAFVELKDEYIFRISKDIHQLNKIDGEAIGLSKVSYEAFKRMLKDYKFNKNPFLNYEYMMINIMDEYRFGYVKIDGLIWTEIDTKEHYKNLIHVVYPKLKIKEMEVRKQYAIETVAKALNVDISDIRDVERLGGLTNKNYKMNINGKNLVARIPGNGTDEMFDRLNEKINSNIAYEIGLSCKNVYFDEKTGLKITEFIENAETINPTTAKKEENIELIAGALLKLHYCDKKFKITFDPFKDTEFYEKLLLEANGKVFEEYYEIKEKFMPLKEELLELGMVYTPCHLDALAENFVKSGEDKIYLIDWEFSGNYDKLWDVATIIVECGYNDDEKELLLNKYFGREALEAERKRIQIHMIMQDMCWSMWAAAKVARGDDYLEDYAIMRFTRGKYNLLKYLEGGNK